ncbi:hypothetical protein TNIN_387081 [Trichonephila inaurata madagascariensis]|uniref:Uncharacterized protein n=1 Tax=Trichonephila inaurata madagascariensis TaxID=2747483 RepID=A0A8X7BXS6_9ARAC|nr:hypothetical protein TNIN_264101 [Trichonephila inaurata madagascariensis]GFY70670.1 hypothetical protein TNIN_387081 [Trichonephila inaurata madagascariensis]
MRPSYRFFPRFSASQVLLLNDCGCLLSNVSKSLLSKILTSMKCLVSFVSKCIEYLAYRNSLKRLGPSKKKHGMSPYKFWFQTMRCLMYQHELSNKFNILIDKFVDILLTVLT